jgi:hypothetical protein
MSSVVISGDTSGTVTVTVPAVSGSNTVTIPAVTGTVMVSSNMPAFSVYCSTNQTITTATYTKIALNTKEFDTNNNFDNATNYRFTPTVAGYYLISGCVYFNIAPTVFTNGSLHIYKNGSSFKFVNLDVNSTDGHFGSTVTSIVYLNGTTDYIELYVYQGIGSSQNLSGGGSNTYLSGSMVRSA